MKLGQLFIFMAVLVSMAVQGSEGERKEEVAQKALDDKLCMAVLTLNRRTDIVRNLLEQKADPNCNYFLSVKIITRAIDDCNSDVVELLLHHRADANSKCDVNEAPLSRAMGDIEREIKYGRIKQASLYVFIAEKLLRHGANPNKDEHNFGFRPLVRCMNGNLVYGNQFYAKPACDLAGLLVRYGADDTVKNCHGNTIHDYAKQYPELQSSLDHHLKDRRALIKQAAADGLPRFSLDVVGVVAMYVL